MRGIVALALGFLLAACGAHVTTKVNGSVDPTHSGSAKFESVAIITIGSKLDDTRVIENAAIKRFADKGVRAVGSFELMPITRNITPEAWIAAVFDAKVDAMMYIVLDDVDLWKHEVPLVYRPGRVAGTVTDYGSHAQITVRQSPGSFTGGYTALSATGTYALELYDVRGASQVWAGEAVAEGGTKNNMLDLGKSAANKAVDRMFEDGLF